MILVCPTDFKGSISSSRATAALAAGVRAAGMRDVALHPLSDGGPGLIDAIRTREDRLEVVTVKGPLGDPADARLLWRDGTCILESADACGLHLVPGRREPWRANTFGVGELIAQAVPRASRLVIGLGGSATVDGGIGMAAALGWRVVGQDDAIVEPVPAALTRVHTLVAPGLRAHPSVIALADVRTHLAGDDGAARVFGPQKGVASGDIARLDQALAHWGTLLERATGRMVARLDGSGAAGGLGAAMLALLDATIVSGSAWVLEQIGFDALLERASLVITGEGSYDAQSALGKITGTVIERAGRRGVPVLLIAGRVEGALPAHVTAVDSGGHTITESDLERIAREHCARLLPL